MWMPTGMSMPRIGLMNVTAALLPGASLDHQGPARPQLAYPLAVSGVHTNLDLPKFIAAGMPLQKRTHRPVLEPDRQGVPPGPQRQDAPEDVEHAIEVESDDRLIHPVNHGRCWPRRALDLSGGR